MIGLCFISNSPHAYLCPSRLEEVPIGTTPNRQGKSALTLCSLCEGIRRSRLLASETAVLMHARRSFSVVLGVCRIDVSKFDECFIVWDRSNASLLFWLIVTSKTSAAYARE